MTRLRRALATAILLAATGLAGCTSTVSLTPAADANNPGCASVMVRLPGTLAGQDRHWTDAQATAAWGSPSTVIFRCGVTPPGPTTLPCQTVNGVDWIIDDADAPTYRFTTFGRTPAVQVLVTYPPVSGNETLQGLGTIISQLPKDAECTDKPTATG